MLQYWWLILIAAGVLCGSGGFLWLYAASAMVQAFAPSGEWLEKESRYNQWGVCLMKAGVTLLAVALAVVSAHWMYD
jgi:hypothetical protein